MTTPSSGNPYAPGATQQAMVLIDTFTPYPASAGQVVTITGADLGVITGLTLSYSKSGPSGIVVVKQSAVPTRVDQNTVTFVCPDFSPTGPIIVEVQGVYQQNGVRHTTRAYQATLQPLGAVPPGPGPGPAQYGYGVQDGEPTPSLSVFRWKFHDPYDADSATSTWIVPINPNAMTSLFVTRTLDVQHTTAIDGQVLLFEGAAKPADWQFSGDILDARHYDLLRSWVYDRNRRLEITDHFGRVITCLLLAFAPIPKRANGKYWRHTYTITGKVLKVTPPTVVPI